MRRRAAWDGLHLRHWRVPWRLLALIATPTAVVVMVASAYINASLTSADQYHRVLEKTELSSAITELTHQLSLERDQAVYYVGAGRMRAHLSPLREQFRAVDAAAIEVRKRARVITASHGDVAWNLTRQMLSRLPEIEATRETVIKSRLKALPTLTKYVQVTQVLEQFHAEISQGVEDEGLSASVRALSAVTKAKDAAGQQRGLLAAAVSVGRFGLGELDKLVSARAQQDSELVVFQSSATWAQRQTYNDIVTGPSVDRAELLRLRALAQASQGARLNIDSGTLRDARIWFEAISGTVNAMRTVEKRLVESINLQAQTLEDSARHTVRLAIIAIMVLLLVVLVVTVIVARSLVQPLRRLRGEALHIAGQRLPDTVRQMRASQSPEQPDVAPISVDSRDEIGEVARAFDEVHCEAVRLAGEESRLRANVNAMFVNLSRRSQTLVERQITLIDGLEQGERDEHRLANLFKLDHLATRMRRNSENLLVLAGQEQPRRWSQPVKLINVARASLSEVENYERVALGALPLESIVGQAFHDVTHLLAELVENALSFSPGETRVTVSGSRIDGGGVMLSITDSGIGMTIEELTQANERLTQLPTVDVSVARRMGLFVVARLAHRHGIRVQLRPQGPNGLTAIVMVPETLLTSDNTTPSLQPTAPMQPTSWPDQTLEGHAAGFPMGQTHPSHPQPGGPPSGSHNLWEGIAAAPVTGRRPRPRSTGEGQRPRRGLPPTDAATGPIQVVNPTSADTDYLPIFAAVESAWFDQGGSDAAWGTAKADAGWSAAQAAAEPVRDGATASGLPKRVPKANLVPGSADTASAPKGVAPMPAVSPDRVRSRLSSFQQGFRAARNDLGAGRKPSTDHRDQ